MTETQDTAHKRPRCCSLRCPIYRSPHSYRDGVDSLTEKAEQGELCAHILCCLIILMLTLKVFLTCEPGKLLENILPAATCCRCQILAPSQFGSGPELGQTHSIVIIQIT
jgi:hypothetical protein